MGVQKTDAKYSPATLGLWGILWSMGRRKSIHSASPAYEKFPPADTPKSSNFEISSWSTGHLIYLQFGATVHRMVDGVALGFGVHRYTTT
jgi:hypothetical protein